MSKQKYHHKIESQLFLKNRQFWLFSQIISKSLPFFRLRKDYLTTISFLIDFPRNPFNLAIHFQIVQSILVYIAFVGQWILGFTLSHVFQQYFLGNLVQR